MTARAFTGSCRVAPAFALVIASGALISVLLAATGTVGESSEGAVVNSPFPVRKILLDGGSDFWMLSSRSNVVENYSMSGRIKDGFDVSAFKDLPNNVRSTIYDISYGPEQDLYMLVGTVDPVTHEIASHFARIRGDSIELITLEPPIAAYKGGVDQQGYLYVLGLREEVLRGLGKEQVKGTFEVLHRFSPDGKFLKSYLPLELDGSTSESYMATVSSPLHHPGNFAVSPTGDAWVVWFDFPPPKGPGPLQSQVFSVKPSGIVTSPLALGTGCFVEGVVEVDGPVGIGVAQHCLGDDSIVVTNPLGDFLYRGAYAGRVHAIDSDWMIAEGVGNIQGRYTILSKPIREQD